MPLNNSHLLNIFLGQLKISQVVSCSHPALIDIFFLCNFFSQKFSTNYLSYPHQEVILTYIVVYQLFKMFTQNKLLVDNPLIFMQLNKYKL